MIDVVSKADLPDPRGRWIADVNADTGQTERFVLALFGYTGRLVRAATTRCAHKPHNISPGQAYRTVPGR
jgi:hypothetical protein